MKKIISCILIGICALIISVPVYALVPADKTFPESGKKLNEQTVNAPEKKKKQKKISEVKSESEKEKHEEKLEEKK